MMDVALTSTWSTGLTYYGGPDASNDNHSLRHVTEWVNHLGLGPFGLQSSLLSATETFGGKQVRWWGAEAIGRYDFHEKFYTALRAEYYMDSERSVAMGGLNGRVAEATATLAIKPSPYFMLRLEVRYVRALGSHILFSDHGVPSPNQLTCAINTLGYLP